MAQLQALRSGAEHAAAKGKLGESEGEADTQEAVAVGVVRVRSVRSPFGAATSAAATATAVAAAAAAAAAATTASTTTAAAAAAPTVADDEWVEQIDSDGERFYFCARTGESAWERPAVAASVAAAGGEDRERGEA